MSHYDMQSPTAAESYFDASIFGHLYTLMAESLGRPGPAPAVAAPRTPSVRPTKGDADVRIGLLDRLDRWYWRREQKARDAFLAESADVFELERRIVALERSGISRYY